MSYNITENEMYQIVLQNTYLSLATGVEEEMLDMVLEVYEQDENYEACAAITVAIENWKAAGRPTNVKTIW